MTPFAKAITAFLVALFALTQLTDHLNTLGEQAVKDYGCGGRGEAKAMICLIEKWRAK